MIASYIDKRRFLSGGRARNNLSIVPLLVLFEYGDHTRHSSTCSSFVDLTLCHSVPRRRPWYPLIISPFWHVFTCCAGPPISSLPALISIPASNALSLHSLALYISNVSSAASTYHAFHDISLPLQSLTISLAHSDPTCGNI